MRISILFFPFLFCFAESFITPLEYGEELYRNPRGIGCHHCHGEKGEGTLIATYRHKGKEIRLEGPKINTLPFERFSRAFERDRGVMPRYQLTDSEITALYHYIKSVNKSQKSN